MALILASINANAGGYLTSTVDSLTGVTIDNYFVHSGGEVTLFISGGATNPDTATCDSIGKVHLKGDLPGHNNMVAAALAAFASGKKIGMYASKCTTITFWGGTVRYPIISNLWVFK